MERYKSQRMFRDVDVLSQCHYTCILKHTFSVPDIRPNSIHIPDYTNIRKLCGYYNMFFIIRFIMYNVKTLYVVWTNDTFPSLLP